MRQAGCCGSYTAIRFPMWCRCVSYDLSFLRSLCLMIFDSYSYESQSCSDCCIQLCFLKMLIRTCSSRTGIARPTSILCVLGVMKMAVLTLKDIESDTKSDKKSDGKVGMRATRMRGRKTITRRMMRQALPPSITWTDTKSDTKRDCTVGRRATRRG